MEKHAHSSSVSGLCSPQGSCSQWSSQEKGSCVTVKKPESSELDNFFTKLSQCSTKPAILSIVTLTAIFQKQFNP